MNRLFVTTLFVLLAIPPLRAECDSSAHWYINLQGGIGYGLYRDLGVSPLTYRGLQLHSGISLLLEKSDWRYEAMFQAAGGAYGLRLGVGYIQAYGGHPRLGFKALHNVYDDSHWHLWVGGSVDDLFDIRYNASLGNASAAFGNFARLNVESCVEYSLCRWLFYAHIQLNALSLHMRPGFAYMDNFDQNIASPTANTFDQYRSYLAIATGAMTDVGATLMLANGNRIGVSYRWSYLTSRTTHAAPHLFECADHALLFLIGLKLN